MCGIAGKVSLRGAVAPELVDAMCDAIVHRGPDSRGMHLEDGVGLGIQRLAVIDLEHGDQPIYNEDRSVVVVSNGEIYNYRELREELIARGHRFATASDTEVIVHLYEEHGDRCVEHLRGMFAFALWDSSRRRLLLARDRVGKKPLFYVHRDGELLFGSETRAVLQDPTVPRDVDFDAIDCFLHYQYVPHPLSGFKALRKLPPAHTLVFEDGRTTLRRYWKLSYRPGGVTSAAEAHELIREELLEATRLRLRSDVPLGAFLSGGVDSSAVVAAMAMQTDRPVKTFAIGFDVAAYDETAHARRVAELYGTEHHEFIVEPDAMELLPKIVWHYGEPFADSSAIPSFMLSRLTREHVTVALNGDGGDECFAGYRRYLANAVIARLSAVPSPLAAGMSRAIAATGTGGRPDSMRTRLARITRAVAMNPRESYAMYMAYFSEAERDELYRPEFQAGLGERTAPRVIADPWDASDATDNVNRLLDVDVNSYLPGDLLVKMDIATMAHSLEVRSPFLDQRFMEMAAGLPGRMKLRRGRTKAVLKDAVRPWLPDDILDRPKMGFGVPLAEWFRGPLRALPEEILLDPRSLERGFFREDRVRGLISGHRDGTADNSGKLWALLQLELWLRSFVDAAMPAPVST